MPALSTPVCSFDQPAVDFSLPDTHGKNWTLQDLAGSKGLLLMFICNHCPYVQPIMDDLVLACSELKKHGVNTAAIMSNDWLTYPDDAPEHMLQLAEDKNFSFPYLIDKTQQVAKQYQAICTPDFFGYNKDLQLQYRGCFDKRGRDAQHVGLENDLYNAMLQIAKTNKGPAEQKSSIGCSIKWRTQ